MGLPSHLFPPWELDMMQKSFQKLRTIFDKALNLLGWISGFVLVGIIISVMIEVFTRTLFNRPQEWVVEITEYALLYITFLSAAFVLKKESHIVVDLVTSRLSENKRAFLSIVKYVVVIVVSLVFVYIGGKTTINNYVRGIYNPTVLQVPIAYSLVMIPIGGFFLLIQSLISLSTYYKKFRERKI
jgi:C4-dicarboxylate transporter, DctQ subunit